METIESYPDDVAALRHMAREFTEGLNCGDVDRLMQFYGGSYVDVNLRHPVQSHEERREYFLHIIRGGRLRVQVHPDEIMVLGQVAFVRGHIELTRQDPVGAGASTTELRYMEIARKGPGGWKVIWGMDGPVQEYQPGSTK